MTLISNLPTGIKDANTIDPEVSLAELGLDSLMGVEIKQLLERDFEVSLNSKEIRLLNMNKLHEFSKFALKMIDNNMKKSL